MLLSLSFFFRPDSVYSISDQKEPAEVLSGVLSVEIRVAQISSEFMNEVKETRRMDFGSTIVK